VFLVQRQGHDAYKMISIRDCTLKHLEGSSVAKFASNVPFYEPSHFTVLVVAQSTDFKRHFEERNECVG